MYFNERCLNEGNDKRVYEIGRLKKAIAAKLGHVKELYELVICPTPDTWGSGFDNDFEESELFLEGLSRLQNTEEMTEEMFEREKKGANGLPLRVSFIFERQEFNKSIEKVEKEGMELQNVSDEMKVNRKVVLEAVKQDGGALG